MARKINRDTKLGTESDSKRDRASDDRAIIGDRVMTDDERLDEFRQISFQSALPDIPLIDGYHVCWLTTENPRDSIPARMRMGYEPIKATDIPGWEHASMKTGEYRGCIGINEMLAFKVPLRLYEAYMKEAHHNQPAMEEEKLNEARRMAEEGASQVARSPISFELEEGQADLGTNVPEPPSFEETLTTKERHPL